MVQNSKGYKKADTGRSVPLQPLSLAIPLPLLRKSLFLAFGVYARINSRQILANMSTCVFIQVTAHQTSFFPS